jgi:hypothetical protein
VDNVREKETFQNIAEVFQQNTTIKRLIMKNADCPSAFFSTLASSLTANPKNALTYLDVSGNEIDVNNDEMKLLTL